MSPTTAQSPESTSELRTDHTERTSPENGEAGFVASDWLVANLQKVVADLIELHLQAKQAHWNVVGMGFRSIHLHLDEIADEVRGFSDTVAERMRALQATPDGRSDTVAATTTLHIYPAGEQSTADTADLIARRLDRVVRTLRSVHNAVDAEDPTSADILHTIIEALDKHAWMISAETRTPMPFV